MWLVMPVTAIFWATAPVIEFALHVPVAEALIFLPLFFVSAYLYRTTSRNGRQHIVEIRCELKRLVGELAVVALLAAASNFLPGIESELTRMALLLAVLARHMGEAAWGLVFENSVLEG